jgi:hypothetical protein
MEANDGVIVPGTENGVVVFRKVATQLRCPRFADYFTQTTGPLEVRMAAIPPRFAAQARSVEELVKHMDVIHHPLSVQRGPMELDALKPTSLRLEEGCATRNGKLGPEEFGYLECGRRVGMPRLAPLPRSCSDSLRCSHFKNLSVWASLATEQVWLGSSRDSSHSTGEP